MTLMCKINCYNMVVRLFSWYHGMIDRGAAENILLEKRENGSYLIRAKDESSGCFAVFFILPGIWEMIVG